MANSNRTKGILPLVLGSLGVASGVSAADQDQAAAKTEGQTTSAAEVAEDIGEIEVTGYRLSLRNAIDIKKNASVMKDAINAEDIADFPDANLAESLQRLPGVALDRDNGEGRGITVRGLGSDFTRVRLNGLETLSTAAAADSGTSPNRGRGFDFNVFASDLFTSLEVTKTASASADEGSLGATVDLVTGKPLDYKGRKLALSMEDAYYENGGTHNPRVAALFADQFFDDRFGVSLSGAYSERTSEIDRYKRQAGQSDYAYRGATFAGTLQTPRAGFAAPEGASLAGTTATNGVQNPAAIAAQTGSDAAAYALLYPGAPYNTPGRFNNSLVRIPSLMNIEQQDLEQERLGLTGAIQWKPTESTNIGLDMVYSKFDQKSDVNQIQSVGLNRNNTNANFNALAPTVTNRRASYATCNSVTALPFREAINCGGSEVVPGGVFAGLGTTSFSTNPNNLDTYDYYNNPLSPGFGASPNGMYFRDRIVGRPGVDVLAAHVSEAGNADYLELRNVDWRSATDSSYFTTQFQQASLSWQQQIGDQLKMDVIYGRSRSSNDNTGLLVEFNRMDSPETFTYDERDHGSMPAINYGFDLADPNNWTLVKGFSSIRHFERETDNDYQGGHVNFDVKINDHLSLEFGILKREYQFKTNEGRRLSQEAQNPTLAELGVTTSELGRVYDFGDGLDLPAGSPRAFFAPNIDKFREIIGFDCSCVNEYGDWTLGYLSNPGNQFSVTEYDTSYFMQINFDYDLFGHRTFGNFGVRDADTHVKSQGYTPSPAATGPRPLEAEHTYNDKLPSLNIAYQLTDTMLLRGGWSKVMARPQLANLAPTITGLTTPVIGSTTVPSVTLGNPELSPFRAENYDLSWEWYFQEGGLLSVAVFKKDVSNFPQTVSTSATLQEILPPDQYQATLQTLTPQQIAWVEGGGSGGGPGLYGVRQFADASGGVIEGYELSYQQDFTFLPGFWKNFGVQANYTHLTSELQYIVDPGNTLLTPTTPLRPQVTAPGPFTGASPDSANFTLYYETSKWSARASYAYRSAYVSQYPIAAGTCDPGVCDAPLVNDFLGSLATRNIDAKVTWQAMEYLSFSIEALNITNQTEDRWAYQDEPLVTQYSSTGRQIFAGFRLSL
ncbi:MAG TPA: TonB-dependent receptor [Steroidobacteraceae bacterium]|nr:TonB-dependent receptor [Steroidobacteraceae bacterium]